MSHDSLTFTLDQLHIVSKELRFTLRDLSMEQRARYKELASQFDELAQGAASGLDEAEITSRAARLLEAFRTFQSHLQPGDSVALPSG